MFLSLSILYNINSPFICLNLRNVQNFCINCANIHNCIFHKRSKSNFGIMLLYHSSAISQIENSDKKNHPLWFSFWAFLFFFMRQVTTQILYKLFDFLNHLSSLYLPHTLYYLTLFFRIIYLNWVYWLFFSHFQKLSLVLLLYLSTYSIEAYGSPAPSMITVWKCPFTPCNCY